MFTIGDFARLAAVSPRTLRYYDEVGLLRPDAVDEATGYRRYSVYQLPRLHRIVALKDLGLTLDQIRHVIDEVDLDRLATMLDDTRHDIEQRLDEDRRRLARVERRLRYLKAQDEMPTDVVIKTIPAIHAAVVECGTPAADFDAAINAIPAGINRLSEALANASIKPTAALFLMYEQSGDTSLTALVVAPIAEHVVGVGPGVAVRVVEGAQAVTTVYQGRGGHEDIGLLYAQLARWAVDHGYTVEGPGRDVLIQPRSRDRDHVIELQLPIRTSHS